MNIISKYKITLTGVLIGAIAGYVYYATVGCNSGSCMITAHPINSMLYGAVLLGMVADTIRTRQITKQKINQSNEQVESGNH